MAVDVECRRTTQSEGVEIDPQSLIEAAQEAYGRAYARYSHYRVGAAVVDEEGQIYTGNNIENAVYPLTMCAERVAIFKAVSSGARRILAVAVVTEDAGSPCGSCRQVMREFAADDMPIFIADLEGNCRMHNLQTLLPDSFGADNLPQDKTC